MEIQIFEGVDFLNEIFIMRQNTPIVKLFTGVNNMYCELLNDYSKMDEMLIGFKLTSNKILVTEAIKWISERIFPRERVDCEDILKNLGLESYDVMSIAEKTNASLMGDDYWVKFKPTEDYYKDSIRGRTISAGLM